MGRIECGEEEEHDVVGRNSGEEENHDVVGRNSGEE